jgi:basic amino acid/polyamine antiporter, APA family
MSRSSPAVAELKPLGLFSLLALGINGTVGVGIFFAPAEVGRSSRAVAARSCI